MPMKRVIRRGSSWSLLRRIWTCFVGIMLLLSSLVLLALSWIFRHCKIVVTTWVLLVTVGQLKDFLHRPGGETDEYGGFHFSDLLLPHRKFISNTAPSKPVWKTIVRCNNHTNWTLTQWLDEVDPLNPSLCESEFIRPRPVMRRRSSPPFKKSKPVQVILLVGGPKNLFPKSPASFLRQTRRYRHLYNDTSSELRIHRNIRWTSWEAQTKKHQNTHAIKEMTMSHWLGEPLKRTSKGPPNLDLSLHPSLLQFGYIASHFVGQDSPLWLIQIPEISVVSLLSSDGSAESQHLATSSNKRDRQPTKNEKGSLTSIKDTFFVDDESSSAERRRLYEKTESDEALLGSSNSIEMVKELMSNAKVQFPGITHDKYDVAGILWWPQSFAPTKQKPGEIVEEYKQYLIDTTNSILNGMDTPGAKMLLIDDGGPKNRKGPNQEYRRLWQQALRALNVEPSKYSAFHENTQSLLLPVVSSTSLSMEHALEHGTTLGWKMARLLRNRK